MYAIRSYYGFRKRTFLFGEFQSRLQFVDFLPVALNEGMVMSTGEIMIVFDADYRPSKNLLKKLATAFNRNNFV